MESMNLVIPLVIETARNSIFLCSHSTIQYTYFCGLFYRNRCCLPVRTRV